MSRWLSPGAETEWIFTKLAAVALRANRRYRFELTGFEEDLQFTLFAPGGPRGFIFNGPVGWAIAKIQPISRSAAASPRLSPPS